MPTKIINVLKDDKFQDILDIFKKTSAQEVIFVLPKKHRALTKEDDFEILSAAAEEQGKNILILTSNPQINNMALEYSFGVLASEKPSKKPKEKAPEPEVIFQEPDLPDEAQETSEEERDDSVDVEDEVEPEEPQVAETISTMKDDGADEADEIEDDSDIEADDNENENGDDHESPDQGISNPWHDDNGAPAHYRNQDQDLPEVQLTAVKKPTKIVSDIVQPGKEGEKVKIGVSKKTERPLEINVRKESPKADIDEIESVWQRPVRLSEGTDSSNQKKAKFNLGKIKEERISSGGYNFRPSFSFFRRPNRMLTILGVMVVVVFAVVIYISTGSAQVLVKLKSYPLDFNLKVTASDKFSEVDQNLKRIPGQLFSVSKTIEETFQSTGEKDVVQKARGKITVYNEYGTTPQVLIATTRFESENGLIFRTLQTITIPGTKVQNGKIIPGSIQVDIIADKAGDTYNISAGKFTIPAFKEKGDSDRYQKFYGMSEVAMKGGIIGKAKVVTDQDYLNAKKKMEERMASEIGQELKSQASGLKVLSLSQPSAVEITSTAQVDEAADNFTLSGKAELQTVGFKESDLHVLISAYVDKVNALMILPEKIQIEFKDVKFDQEGKTLEFAAYFKGPGYKHIDKDKIISDLMNKNEENIKEYIKDLDGIVSAKVILSPFWVRKVPTDKDKIKFEVQYD